MPILVPILVQTILWCLVLSFPDPQQYLVEFFVLKNGIYSIGNFSLNKDGRRKLYDFCEVIITQCSVSPKSDEILNEIVEALDVGVGFVGEA